MEKPRAVILILLLLFLFFSPDARQSSRDQTPYPEVELARERQALQLLRNASYGRHTLYTNSSRNDTDILPWQEGDSSWPLLPTILDRARSQFLQLFPEINGGSEDGTSLDREKRFEAATDHPLPLYHNISGTIQGDFVRQSLEVDPETYIPTTMANSSRDGDHRRYLKNVTDQLGRFSFHFHDDETKLAHGSFVREISADMAIQTDSSSGNGWDVKASGVHYLRTGSIILTTTSDKFPGIFMLPHLARTESEFQQAQNLLNRSLTATLAMHDGKVGGDTADHPHISSAGDTSDHSVSSCDFIIYLQQQPVRFKHFDMAPNQALRFVQQVENEIRFPKGEPIPEPPPLVFTALVFSPDCRFVLESAPNVNHASSRFLTGPKVNFFWELARNLLFALVISLGMQISLIKRQMNEASAPSARSRISYYAIAIMAMGDGFLLTTLIAASLVGDTGFLILVTAGFLCFFNFAFCEMRFIYDIWLVQVGSSRGGSSGATNHNNLDNSRPHGETRENNESDESRLGSEFLPTTPRPTDAGATPIILPPDQDIDATAIEEAERDRATRDGPANRNQNTADFQSLYSRFYLTMLVVIFFTLWTVSWPKRLRSIYVNMLCVLYLSFWVPQVYRNTMRNCRKALSWEYVIGISILRLLPIWYCYTSKSNIFRTDTDVVAAAVFAAWLSLQILVLGVQQFIGPRSFVKDSWCPPAYDYHPLLQIGDADGDVESGSLLPVGFVASASKAKDLDKDKTGGEEGTDETDEPGDKTKVFDCAICMNKILVSVVQNRQIANSGQYGVGLLARRAYMVTPCRHIFHSECLEGWMRFRLVCPICRESLPAL